MNQSEALFLDKDSFYKYIDDDKRTSIENLIEYAKEAKLTSRHVYKIFNGIFAQGNLSLLSKPKIAIIGTRTPNQYAKQICSYIASTLSQNGFIIISGGAVGIDCIAHKNSGHNSILVLPSGINMNYPKENSAMIDSIRHNGLVLSEYENDFKPMKHSFLERNRLIIALSDIVIIPQADIRSGTSSSANLAKALQKNIFVLPHRINESLCTQELLEQGKAECIYNIESFVKGLCSKFNLDNIICESDEVLEFAKNQGLFEEALQKFGNKVFEYELEGKIKRNGLYMQLC